MRAAVAARVLRGPGRYHPGFMTVLLFRLLGMLPLRALHALGAALGWVPWLLSRSYRDRLRENLPLDLAARRTVLRRAVCETGKQILESAWVWNRSPEELARHVRCADPETERSLVQDPRPLLMLTPHLGCFEVIAQSYMAGPSGRARPMVALYRVPRKAALKPLLEQARARNGLQLAPAGIAGVRMMLRGLRTGHLVALLPDQVPSRGDGVWAPFFGRPAFTMTLPSRLVHSTGATVGLFWAERLPRGAGYLLHWERLAQELTGDAAGDAAVINRALERAIRKCPEQYLWSYNRYKAPPGAPPPPGSPDPGGAP